MTFSLRQRFDGSDAVVRGLKTASTTRSGHDQRVANAPEWLMNDPAVRAVLLRAFPKMNTNPTQRNRAGRWALLINLYFRQGVTTLGVAMILRHSDIVKKFGRGAQAWDAMNAPGDSLERLMKRVEDTAGRILRVGNGLRTDGKPRTGKMGRPGKV